MVAIFLYATFYIINYNVDPMDNKIPKLNSCLYPNIKTVVWKLKF